MPALDTEFALHYCKQTATKYWNKLPYEDRAVLSLQDFTQDLLYHYLIKSNQYIEGRPFKPWCRTVIYNKAISICTAHWDLKITQKQANFFPFSDNSLVTSIQTDHNNLPEVILATEITPESILIQIEQEAQDMAGVNITIAEVKELCERFTIDFYDDDVRGSLISVLSYTLGDGMTQDEYDALPEELQAKLSTLADAIDADGLSITSKPVGKQAKATKAKTQKQEKQIREGRAKKDTTPGPGKGRRNEDGPVNRIREAFDEGNGIVTCAPMIAHLIKIGVDFKPATVSTQVGRLRKAYGLTGEGPGRGTKPKSGIVGKIRELYAQGVKTVAEQFAELTELKLEFSPSTVRTQVGILRKADGLKGEHRGQQQPITLPANLGDLINASVTEVSLG